MAYTIKPATIQDGLTLAASLAPADRRELEVAQAIPESTILRGLQDSLAPVAIFDKDGRLAAIAGVVPLDFKLTFGAPWMLTTRFAGTEPVSFVKQAKEWVTQQLCQYQLLSHKVYRYNLNHIRLLKLLGFRISKPLHATALFLEFHQHSPLHSSAF